MPSQWQLSFQPVAIQLQLPQLVHGTKRAGQGAHQLVAGQEQTAQMHRPNMDKHLQHDQCLHAQL
jgi:hypothetical protein